MENLPTDKINFGKKYAFFRPDHAITFQAVSSQKKFATVNVDIAPCHQKKANWANKTSLQLSEVDLFKFMYCLSHKKYFKYQSKYHGSNNRKSIEFNESKDGCKITLSDNGKICFFLCSPGEWFYAQMLIIEQFLGQALSLTEVNQLMLLKKE